MANDLNTNKVLNYNAEREKLYDGDAGLHLTDASFDITGHCQCNNVLL